MALWVNDSMCVCEWDSLSVGVQYTKVEKVPTSRERMSQQLTTPTLGVSVMCVCVCVCVCVCACVCVCVCACVCVCV